MRRKIIFIVFLVLLINYPNYSFWVWSPKTKKWKNPKYSPLAVPSLQLEEGLKFFNNRNYKQAIVSFRKVIIHYPDSKEAQEAQFYLGESYYKLGELVRAFQEYERLIKRYPNSKYIEEVLQRQYNIGEELISRSPKLLGLDLYNFVEHPAITVFQSIIKNAPYSEVGVKAQYKLGTLFLELGRLEEAKDTFQTLVDNHPDSEWAQAGKYQLALILAKTSLDSDYDQTTTQEAIKKLEDFTNKYPDLQVTPQMKENINILRNREAKKNFDIAQFYMKQKKYESAKIYYNIVVKEYYETEWATKAKEKLKELERIRKK